MKQHLRDKYFLLILAFMKTFTISGFAKKHKLSKATVWRWATIKRFNKRLKMYDAQAVKTEDGKIIIQQEIKTS